MKINYSWLAELVDPIPSPQEVAQQFIARGFEVEEVVSPGEAIQEVVVAKLLERNPHPNADKLSLCTVTDGSGTYSIVCGANNMKAGDSVALARLGAVLPDDFKIERRKIRGVESSGMLCSTRELQLGEDHSGIMILPETYKIGERLVDEMGLNDTIYDISITPNRPDAANAVGLAREIAAHNNSKLNLPSVKEIEPAAEPDYSPDIRIEADDLCYRYAGLVIKNIKIAPSPDWLKTRLEACGVRSINNVVDATNYVLLETGQPLHAFDLDKLIENRIVVRRAKKGEKLVAIDGDERELDDTMLVIADAKSPVAIAGVMGGLESEVGDSTTSILLESAYFVPGTVHKTSKQLKLISEASYRFARGVDFEGVIPAAWRCAQLICELAGGKVAGKMTIADTADNVRFAELLGHEQTLKFEYCNRLLGKTIAPEEIEEILATLGFVIKERDAQKITVRVPSYRNDVQIPADLVEEVARSHGYDNFVSEQPYAPVRPPEKQAVDRHLVNRIREYLASCGLDEAVTYSFTSKEALAPFVDKENAIEDTVLNLENPISPRETTMRSLILPALLLSAQRNAAHFNADFGLFEIGRVYLPNAADAATEIAKTAAVLCGHPQSNWRGFKSEMDFFDVKGIVEGLLQICGIKRFRTLDAPAFMHPKRSAMIQAGKNVIGLYGELHPDVAEKFELKGRVSVFEFDLAQLSAFTTGRTLQYKPYSVYPAVKRDFAFLAPQSAAKADIEDCIRKESGELLEELEIFDYYRGKQVTEGRVSVGFRLTFRSQDGTLKEEDVEEVSTKIVKTLQDRFDIQVRS